MLHYSRKSYCNDLTHSCGVVNLYLVSVSWHLLQFQTKCLIVKAPGYEMMQQPSQLSSSVKLLFC